MAINPELGPNLSTGHVLADLDPIFFAHVESWSDPNPYKFDGFESGTRKHIWIRGSESSILFLKSQLGALQAKSNC